jgi:hypothetical protein
MKAIIVLSVLLLTLLLLCPRVLWAKNSFNWLEQYLYQPRLAGDQRVLALVEVTDVAYDRHPPRYYRTGTLTLRTIEAVGGSLPRSLRVGFSLRGAFRSDGWAWDDVEFGLHKGRWLLGFFNQRHGEWEVPQGSASGIIQNVERIHPATRKAVQKQFKIRLFPPPSRLFQPQGSHPAGLWALPADSR